MRGIDSMLRGGSVNRSAVLALVLMVMGAGCGGSTSSTEDPGAVSGGSTAVTAIPLLPPPADRYGGGGIAGVGFGEPAEVAVAALTEQLGAPDIDDGWETPPAYCEGTQIRILGWLGTPGGLQVHLTDAETAYASSGTPHLAYWLASGEFGLRSPSGFVPGLTTLSEVQAEMGPITFVEVPQTSFSEATPAEGPEAGIKIRVQAGDGSETVVYSMSAGDNPCG